MGAIPVINATDYGTIQLAVDAIPTQGGIVYIPEGYYNTSTPTKYTPTLTLPPDRPVRLIGAGKYATFLQVLSSDTQYANSDMILVRGDYQTVEDLSLANQLPAGAGTGRGIVLGRPVLVNPRVPLRQVLLSHLRIDGTPTWGIYFLSDGTSDPNGITDSAVDANSITIHTTVSDVWVRGNKTITTVNGAVRIGQGCTTIWLRELVIDVFKWYGLYMSRVKQVSMLGGDISNPADDSRPFLYFTNCRSCSVDGTYFEKQVAPHTQRFIDINGTNENVAIMNCNFDRAGTTNPNGISVGADGRSIVIANPSFGVAAPVSGTDHISLTGSTTEAVILSGSVIDSNSLVTRPRVSDGTTKSILVGYNGRIRLPRLTTTERNALLDTVAGDLIFNTDTGVKSAQVYDGGAWKTL